MKKYIKDIDSRPMNMNKALTIWEPSNSKIISQWGEITYEDWCIKESARMNANGGDTLVCREPKGYIAVCRP